MERYDCAAAAFDTTSMTKWWSEMQTRHPFARSPTVSQPLKSWMVFSTIACPNAVGAARFLLPLVLAGSIKRSTSGPIQNQNRALQSVCSAPHRKLQIMTSLGACERVPAMSVSMAFDGERFRVTDGLFSCTSWTAGLFLVSVSLWA